MRSFLLLAGLLGLAGCAEPDGIPRGGDVLLIVVDTLRADALSSYGNPAPTSPNLDALATDGIRFVKMSKGTESDSGGGGLPGYYLPITASCTLDVE